MRAVQSVGRGFDKRAADRFHILDEESALGQRVEHPAEVFVLARRRLLVEFLLGTKHPATEDAFRDRDRKTARPE